MASFSHRRPISRRPRRVGDGQFFFAMPRSMIERRAEEALIVSFVSDRKLFGLAYWMVQPDYFDDMPTDSGVFVSPLVRTRDIISEASKPGDIDLLVIPYEGEELVLDRVLAIEVKAIRARFVQKGKSPNDFGFSQGLALLELGFPYAAVAHLIVSDQSPEDYWTEVTRATVLDQHGALGEFIQTRIDTMPGELMDRSFGRLRANCATDNLGLISAYVSLPLFNGAGESQGHSIWHPTCRAATVNGKIHFDVLDSIAAYFQDNAERFLDNPRYDRIREQG